MEAESVDLGSRRNQEKKASLPQSLIRPQEPTEVNNFEDGQPSFRAVQ